MLTTPVAIKSLMLRFVESVLILNDLRSRQRTRQLRSNMVNLGCTLEVLREGVVLIDEVDWVLHPLKSELNFPTGLKNQIDFAPTRWDLPLHLISAIFLANPNKGPPSASSQKEKRTPEDATITLLREAVEEGIRAHVIMMQPHLVLLDEAFYHSQMKPLLLRWLSTFLDQQRTGRQFVNQPEEGLHSAELYAYIGNSCPTTQPYYLVRKTGISGAEAYEAPMTGPYFPNGDDFVHGATEREDEDAEWVLKHSSAGGVLGRRSQEDFQVCFEKTEASESWRPVAEEFLGCQAAVRVLFFPSRGSGILGHQPN